MGVGRKTLEKTMEKWGLSQLKSKFFAAVSETVAKTK